MPDRSNIKMTGPRFLIVAGILTWCVPVNGELAVEQDQLPRGDRLAEQIVCRSESEEDVVSFSDYPGDCARGGDAVTIRFTVPRQADIGRQKAQYMEILDLLDRMAEDRSKKDLRNITRRQAKIENALAQIRLDLSRRRESEVHHVRRSQSFRPRLIPVHPHRFHQSFANNRSSQSQLNQRFLHGRNNPILNITPGIIGRPELVHFKGPGKGRF